MQRGGNRKILGKETALGSAQGGGMIRGSGVGIQPGAALGRRQQGLDKQAAAFEMGSGRRMAGQDMRQEIKDIYEDETRLGRAIQGGLQLVGQGGAHYLKMKKLKEIADQKKLQEMMQPDEASEYAASEIDSLLEDQALAKRLEQFAPDDPLGLQNPAYDALSLEDKIAFNALAAERDKALYGDAVPGASGQPLTREQQIANLRAMEPVAEPVSAPAVEERAPTPIEQIALTDEEDAALLELFQENAAFLKQRRANAIAAAKARMDAAIENNDAFAFMYAQRDYHDILRGDF